MISGDSVRKAVQPMMEQLCEILYLSKEQRQDIFLALNCIVSGRRLYPEKEVVPSPQISPEDGASKKNWGLLAVAHFKGVQFDST